MKENPNGNFQHEEQPNQALIIQNTGHTNVTCGELKLMNSNCPAKGKSIALECHKLGPVCFQEISQFWFSFLKSENWINGHKTSLVWIVEKLFKKKKHLRKFYYFNQILITHLRHFEIFYKLEKHCSLQENLKTLDLVFFTIHSIGVSPSNNNHVIYLKSIIVFSCPAYPTILISYHFSPRIFSLPFCQDLELFLVNCLLQNVQRVQTHKKGIVLSPSHANSCSDTPSYRRTLDCSKTFREVRRKKGTVISLSFAKTFMQ